MRIAHVVYSCLPGCFRGGISKAVFELSVAQAGHGHSVDIYTTVLNSGKPTLKLPGSVEWSDGVRIRYFDVVNRQWYTSPSLRSSLEAHLHEYDVIHGHNTYLALNRYAAKAAGGRKPLFFHVHGALDPVVVRAGFTRRLRKEAYIRWFERSNFSAASGIIALSKIESAHLRQWGITRPIYVVPNGINVQHPDLAAAKVFRDRYSIREDEPIVAYVGRIVPKKALDVLVAAFSSSRAVEIGGRLVIAGDRQQDPEYVRALDALARDRGVEGRIVWTGFLDEDAKRGLLAAAAVFSHATRSEGMAMSPLEAMATGVPTIVSDTCYMDAAVEAGAVLEVSCDVASLTKGLDLFLTSEAARLEFGVKGRRYVAQHHAWSGIANQVIEYYELAGTSHSVD